MAVPIVRVAIWVPCGNLEQVEGGPSLPSVGGAGTNGIFLTGILAVLLASLSRSPDSPNSISPIITVLQLLRRRIAQKDNAHDRQP
jgi:hypothetical protein